MILARDSRIAELEEIITKLTGAENQRNDNVQALLKQIEELQGLCTTLSEADDKKAAFQEAFEVSWDSVVSAGKALNVRADGRAMPTTVPYYFLSVKCRLDSVTLTLAHYPCT